jgi:hypothetical protein
LSLHNAERTPLAHTEAAAFVGMAQNLLDASTERNNLVRPYRERYQRLQDDLRTTPARRVKAAAEFLQAAYSADHIYGERVDEGLGEYQRLTTWDDESRY